MGSHVTPRTLALLTGAAQALRAALPFTHVLVLDCAGKPAATQTAAEIGWGDVPAQQLGNALLTLPRYADSVETGLSGASRPDCVITELKGPDLAELNAKIPPAASSGPFAAALSVECRLRGHVVVAILGSVVPARDLTDQERSVAEALFAVLGTTIGFVAAMGAS